MMAERSVVSGLTPGSRQLFTPGPSVALGNSSVSSASVGFNTTGSIAFPHSQPHHNLGHTLSFGAASGSGTTPAVSSNEKTAVHFHPAKPIAMKLFALGDQSRIPSFCTSRICSVRLTHLVVLKSLEQGLPSFTIAVKMERSKRTLRSTDIVVPERGILDMELDLSLSLQYPHYLKQRRNLLLVMLQRRKRYKNRRMLGYKTLAVGTVDMNEVLQRSVDQDLNMYANPKSKEITVARMSLNSLATQPAAALLNGKEPLPLEDENTSEDDEFFSDVSDSEGDGINDEPDALRSHGHARVPLSTNGKLRRKLLSGRQANLKQKFISLLRRFKASESGLEADPNAEVDIDDLEAHDKGILEDELLDELDFDSDSGPEFFDNISVQSTPRPHLSPYFKPGRSASTMMEADKLVTSPMATGVTFPGMEYPSQGTTGIRVPEKSDEGSRNNSDSHPDNLTDEDAHGLSTDKRHPEESGKEEKRKSGKTTVFREKSWSLKDRDKDKKPDKDKDASLPREFAHLEAPARKYSQTIPVELNPRATLLEQLQQSFPSPDEELPGTMLWVNGNHLLGKRLQERLTAAMAPSPVVSLHSTGDFKACFSQLISRLNKPHFGRKPGNPNSITRVVLCGGDEFVNAALRAYVELFSDRPLDWQNGIRFVFIPVGQGGLAKYLLQIDAVAAKKFNELAWFAPLEQNDPDEVDWEYIVNTIQSYLETSQNLINLPVLQAMINVKSQGTIVPESESSQIFVPFLIDVKISGSTGSGSGTEVLPSPVAGSTERENDPGVSGQAGISGAMLVPGAGNQDFPKDFSPPHSPNVGYSVLPHTPGSSPSSAMEGMELQVDFWTPGSGSGESDKEKDKKRAEVVLSITQTQGTVPAPLPEIQEKKSSKNAVKETASAKTSLKAAFKLLYVMRPMTQASGSAAIQPNAFNLAYAVKEKKIPLMRALGKKGRDSDLRTVVVDGVSRLICRISKPTSGSMKVAIDGCDWHNINFFQLSPHWHSTVKQFPLLISRPL